MTEEYFIRCEELLIGEGYTDECGEYVPTGSRVELQFRAYLVVKYTPCGVVISAGRYGGETKFINFSWNKQFAHATKEKALESFIARKRRQESIHLARARTAVAARQLAEHQLASLEGHPVPLSLADVREMNA